MIKKYGKYFVLAILAVAIAVSGVSAYFTATDNATNTFDVKEVDVELTEPKWDEEGKEDAEDVTPNDTIAKDPTVQNIGNTDQFVFLKVTVPYKNIITAKLDGTQNAAADTELFSWNTATEQAPINAAPGANTNKVNSGWTLVATNVDSTKSVVEYTYAYGSDTTMTVLAPEAYTAPLFNTVTMCNAIEGQGLENQTVDIDVEVYAIQTSDLGESKTVVPSEVLAIYLNQNPVN
jgi:predicted ribosomally synthesized peptide with SipW-like signal peptide